MKNNIKPRSLKLAPHRQVIGNQFTADQPLRVIAEGFAPASLTTRAQSAKGESYDES